jgi:hypothetical protein
MVKTVKLGTAIDLLNDYHRETRLVCITSVVF